MIEQIKWAKGEWKMKRTNTICRRTALVICLILIIGLFSVTVLADDAATANEAKIDNTEYATLTAAIEAVTNSESKTGTIVLLRDIALGSVTDKINHYLIPAGTNVTLDLAGHKVSATDNTGSMSGGYYFFENRGTFIVKDSSGNDSGEIATTVGQNRSEWMETASVCNCGGIVNIESGTIRSTGYDSSHLCYAADNLTYTGSTQMTITGGKLVSNYNVVRIYNQNNFASNYKVENDCSLTITGGVFESAGGFNPLYIQRDWEHHGKMTVRIDGGTFNVSDTTKSRAVIFCDNYDIDDAEAHKINITINGGTYNENIQNIAQYYYDVDGIGTVTVNGGTFKGYNPIRGGAQNYGFTFENNTDYQIGVIPPNDSGLCYIPINRAHTVTYPAAGVDANNDNKPDPAADPVKDGKAVTVDPNGGTWRDTVDKTVLTPTDNITLEDPTAPTGKVFVGWIAANDGNGNYTYTAQYEGDLLGGGDNGGSPDGIPDRYQAKVNWIAVNAVFTDSGKTSEIEYVTLTDASGRWSAAGSATIRAGRDVTLNAGYRSGSYNKRFPLTITKAATIVYTAAAGGSVGGNGSADAKPEAEDHFAYIVGYSDGCVHPEANISRAEVATIFFRLLKEDVRTNNLTASNSFSDVPSGAWYNMAVSTLVKMGTIRGYGDETFRPNAPITRAEFAVIAARAYGSDGQYAGSDRFSDISGQWAEGYINDAAELGLAAGYKDSTFRPDAYITRAEAMMIVNRFLDRDRVDLNSLLAEMHKWPDNADTSAWYYCAVQEATNSHDCIRRADHYETWTKLNPPRNWPALEKTWAAAIQGKERIK
jgi:hypothetical protein